MGTLTRFSILLILLPILTLWGWRQDSHSQGRATMAGHEWSELMASMDRMHVAMASIKPSGNDDTDFVELMLPHHEGASEMAKAELLYGKDPQMRRLAQVIITDQESEIQLMQLWLKQHGPQPKSSSPKAN